MDDNDLRRKLRGMIEASGKTKRAIAHDIGISESYLYDVLRGKRTCGPTVLKWMGYVKETKFKKG